MKKLLIALTLVSSSVLADGHHHSDFGWAPIIAGGLVAGAITYEVNRPPYYSTPIPMIPQPYQSVPYGYHYQQIWDQYCECYKQALVPN